MIDKLVNKIKRKWMKLRLQPIHVLVFHHVSDLRDSLVCQEDDWTRLDQFKQNIESLGKQYKFISLSDASYKLQHDKIRRDKYAVLTTDDGLASVLNVIPWLEEKKIPLALFINTRYMEGDIIKPVHKKWLQEEDPNVNEKEIAKRMYLSKEQIWKMDSPLIEIGLHGHEHLDATQISESVFEKNVDQCKDILSKHPRYVPAYAYTWGRSTLESLKFLRNNKIIPLLVRGGKNYQWEGYIDRECIDHLKI